MKTANATDVKNKFGKYLDHARTEAVEVRKTGRPVAVLLSWNEYERLMALDNAWWAEQARNAEKKGYVGPAKTMKLIKRRMREKVGSHT